VTSGFASHPKESVLRNFYQYYKSIASAGFEPASLGSCGENTDHYNTEAIPHLDYFPANVRSFSDEQEERFHHVKEKERRYQGRWNVRKMADYFWMLQW
jgi:hypothetical protein